MKRIIALAGRRFYQRSRYLNSGRVVAAVAVIGAASSGSALAAPTYSFQSLSGSGVNSTGLGINNSGEVVGELLDSSTAAYSVGGKELHSLGGNSSVAYGVNDNGIAVGSYEPTGPTVPFSVDTKTAGAAITPLLPAGGQGTAYAATGSTNASFVAVGVTQEGNTSVATAFGPNPLDPRTFAPTDTSGSAAFGVNQVTRGGGTSLGVVGQVDTTAGHIEGFYYGTLSGSPTTPGFYALGLGSGTAVVQGDMPTNQANGINSSGEIVGSADFGSGERAFSYDGYYGDNPTQSNTAPDEPLSLSGTYANLGTLNGTDTVDSTGNFSEGLAINSSGYIVGDSTFVSADVADEPVDTHAFIYIPGSGLLDLNSLVPAADLDGYILETATGINDNGDISGTALDSDLVSHAFLLTPTEIPEPVGLAGVAVLISVGMSRRSRSMSRRFADLS